MEENDITNDAKKCKKASVFIYISMPENKSTIFKDLVQRLHSNEDYSKGRRYFLKMKKKRKNLRKH